MALYNFLYCIVFIVSQPSIMIEDQTERDLHTPYARVSFRMTLSDLE